MPFNETFFYSFYFEFRFRILSFSTYIVDYLNNIHLKEEILVSILEFRKKKNFFFVMKVLSLRVNTSILSLFTSKSPSNIVRTITRVLISYLYIVCCTIENSLDTADAAT